jgi:hypothetical protein
MQSKATTVKAYLESLPADRRAAIEAVRKTILDNLDKGFEEGMQYGMIGYYVPHSIFPAGYHCDPKQPLGFVGLASQKQYMAIYLGTIYHDSDERDRFVAEWKKTGKKLDMGKVCIRFKTLDGIPLDVVARSLKRTKLKKYVADYQAVLANHVPGKAKAEAMKKKAAKKSTKKATKKKAARK